MFHPLLRILLFLMSAWSPSTVSPETSQTMPLRPLRTSVESLITKATCSQWSHQMPSQWLSWTYEFVIVNEP